MKVLGLDLETTGLDLEKDRIIEIAQVLYDTELRIPLRIYSEFINEPHRPKIDKSKVAADITDEMIEEYGIDPKGCILDIEDMFHGVKYVVAQNGNQFDKIMLPRFFDRYDSSTKCFSSIPWIDTRTDIEYPPHCASRNLTYLAAFHGFVNPFPHRALFDTMTMLRVLSNYDIDKVIERMESPSVTLRALVSYENKDLAKVQGFMWNPDDKIWYRDMKECDVTDEWMDSLDFKVKIITVRERNE